MTLLEKGQDSTERWYRVIVKSMDSGTRLSGFKISVLLSTISVTLEKLLNFSRLQLPLLKED